MKGYEYLRQLEYRIAILRDKLDYLGENSCNANERELASLAEFAPLLPGGPGKIPRHP